MTAVPVEATALVEIEDQQGQRANVKVNFGFTPDIITDAGTYWNLTVSSGFAAVFNPNAGNDIVRKIAAVTNAKVVRVGLILTADWATEPTGETGSHKYVQEKARTFWKDGRGLQSMLAIPAPIDGIFLTGVGMQTVVDPTNAAVLAIATAVQAAGANTRGGGTWGSQFFGGQLSTGKPPRRRRIQST